MTLNSTQAVTDSASMRLPLATLQLVFAFLLCLRVGFLNIMREFDGPIIGVVLLLTLILLLPHSLLSKGWAIVCLTAADTGLLVVLTEGARMIETWVYLGYLLVMLIASFSPSLPQFATLGGLLCIVYGVSVYRFGSLLNEQTLLIPILLAMVMVYAQRNEKADDELDHGTETKEKARPESMNDALTGLPNRAHFLDQLWRAIQCGQNNQEFMFAVLFVDLDGFKPINDGLGHKAGDAVLIETAKRLQTCLRRGDLVARYGGDEFTLLVNNVNGKADAIRVAERVIRRMEEPFRVGQGVQVGASIGIALSTNLHERPDDLIRDADMAMYHAKSQGKGRYEVSDQLRDVRDPAGAHVKLLQ